MPPSPRRVLLELCIASADDAVAAESAGADRVELNTALGLGGLTPSLGLLRETREATRLPVVAMIRPRPAGFDYSPRDFRIMRRDAEICLAHGADGVAFGILGPDGRIDRARCSEFLSDIPATAEKVFHRAFDVTPDPFEALETLIDLGITRVLTSGQQESAYAGAPLIADLIRRAAGQIEILPGGGINRFTVRDVVDRTGCNQIHASLRSVVADGSTSGRPSIYFGASFRPPEDRYDATDPARVAEIVRMS